MRVRVCAVRNTENFIQRTRVSEIPSSTIIDDHEFSWLSEQTKHTRRARPPPFFFPPPPVFSPSFSTLLKVGAATPAPCRGARSQKRESRGGRGRSDQGGPRSAGDPVCTAIPQPRAFPRRRGTTRPDIPFSFGGGTHTLTHSPPLSFIIRAPSSSGERSLPLPLPSFHFGWFIRQPALALLPSHRPAFYQPHSGIPRAGQPRARSRGGGGPRPPAGLRRARGHTHARANSFFFMHTGTAQNR